MMFGAAIPLGHREQRRESEAGEASSRMSSAQRGRAPQLPNQDAEVLAMHSQGHAQKIFYINHLYKNTLYQPSAREQI